MYKKSKNYRDFPDRNENVFYSRKKNSTVTHNMGIEVMRIGPTKMKFFIWKL